jgi:tetratricopeptide (TPR) repeat protein
MAGRVALTVAFVAAGLSPLKAQYASARVIEAPKPGDNKEWAKFKDAPPPLYRLGIEERNGYYIASTRDTVVKLVGRLFDGSKSIPYADYAGFFDFLRRSLKTGGTNINYALFEGVMAGDYDCDRGCFVGAQIASMRGYRVSFVFTRDHMLLMLDGKYYADIAGSFDPVNKASLESKYGPICLETDDVKTASFVVYNNLALKKYRGGSPEVAIALADTAIALAPGVARLYYNRALFKTQLKDFNGAENDLNRGLGLDMVDDMLHYQFYKVKMARKDYANAYAYLKTALVLSPNDFEYKDKMSELLRLHPEVKN